MSGHLFPNGEKQLFITCQEGEWQVENAEWDTIPHCERKDELTLFVCDVTLLCLSVFNLVCFDFLALLVNAL
jgi:hypothetical protein